jgi:hypothetical protein
VSRADLHFFKRRGGKISSGVQAAPLSELRQGLVLGLKTFTQNSRGEAKWGGGVEHFIRGIREIFDGFILGECTFIGF